MNRVEDVNGFERVQGETEVLVVVAGRSHGRRRAGASRGGDWDRREGYREFAALQSPRGAAKDARDDGPDRARRRVCPVRLPGARIERGTRLGQAARLGGDAGSRYPLSLPADPATSADRADSRSTA